MSSIDKYRHELLGYIECDSAYDIVCESDAVKYVALYRLQETIPHDEYDFDGVSGDILLGGGSGEAPAFRLSMPDTLNFFFKDDWQPCGSVDEVFKAFWSPTESFKLCSGFLKYGWNPDRDIEYWLAENISALLVERQEYKSLFDVKANSDLVFVDVLSNK